MNGTGSSRRIVRLAALMVVIGSTVLGTGASFARADSVPPSPNAEAISNLDTYFRQPLGIANGVWDDKLAEAAQNHAQYWADGGAFGHYEVPGQPGFTGVAPQNRCAAVGAPSPCGEVAAGYVQVVEGMWDLLQVPYHGLALISTSSIGCGFTLTGTDCDLFGNATVDSTNAAAFANVLGSPVRVWPYDGANDVPLKWLGGESPDPLANYTGDKNDVGPPLYIYANAGAGISLLGPAGTTVPLIALGAQSATPTLTTQPGWTAALVGQLLTPGGAYTLTVMTPDGLTRSVNFMAVIPNSVTIQDPGASSPRSLAVTSVAPNVQAVAYLTATAQPTTLPVSHLSGTTYSADVSSLAPGYYGISAFSGGLPTKWDGQYAQTMLDVSPTPVPNPAPAGGSVSIRSVKVSGTLATVLAKCVGAGTSCKIAFVMFVTETLKGGKVVAVSAATTKKVVTVGSASSLTLAGGQSKTVHISLNAGGRGLVAKLHKLTVKLKTTQTSTAGKTSIVSTRTITFKAAAKKMR